MRCQRVVTIAGSRRTPLPALAQPKADNITGWSRRLHPPAATWFRPSRQVLNRSIPRRPRVGGGRQRPTGPGQQPTPQAGPRLRACSKHHRATPEGQTPLFPKVATHRNGPVNVYGVLLRRPSIPRARQRPPRGTGAPVMIRAAEPCVSAATASSLATAARSSVTGSVTGARATSAVRTAYPSMAALSNRASQMARRPPHQRRTRGRRSRRQAALPTVSSMTAPVPGAGPRSPCLNPRVTHGASHRQYRRCNEERTRLSPRPRSPRGASRGASARPQHRWDEPTSHQGEANAETDHGRQLIRDRQPAEARLSPALRKQGPDMKNRSEQERCCGGCDDPKVSCGWPPPAGPS